MALQGEKDEKGSRQLVDSYQDQKLLSQEGFCCGGLQFPTGLFVHEPAIELPNGTVEVITYQLDHLKYLSVHRPPLQVF